MGRMGRLVLRAAWGWPEFEFVQLNDPAGDANATAHLLKFDSVHGTWGPECDATEAAVIIDGQALQYSQNRAIEDTDWSACDLVIEASGKFKSKQLLETYLQQGVKRVLVTAPVKQDGVLDLVMGVNHHLYNAAEHRLVTAASCTTNCLAPVVKVLHEKLALNMVP